MKGYSRPELDPQEAWFNEAEEYLLSTLDNDVTFDSAMRGLEQMAQPSDDSPELTYLRDHRQGLGGWVPQRSVKAPPLKAPPREAYKAYFGGSGEREPSTTIVFVDILNNVLFPAAKKRELKT